ncbi:TonB-dependent receptor plug domain-containing protein, partial [candidate division KSB1 bacterium]|nr:TonB-dependent receptor plug domain-containing protein [candidate division KSB1 bacterium]NIR71310.1 TonB-dependent receptor plug domain-containing protein [candidate division KSB1 bacterium]NIS27931.1 TonB-dependent receptor plug domain-containing protein [candidate division KSB1 bacterium]NIT74812.1 TonB-dependent receptor plug domain-containing protein [candidate division KSB1 bacterium]NIU28590.1 TonB-dependent receptor plug domain-containing protein [candidate division KSB1 bacterium]
IEDVYLQPRVIELPGVEIQEEYQKLEIEKDLPQTVSVIESRNFEIQGFVDAGDLLRIDHSVQIDEELSGKKTAAIRGGNPDEVVVLYNGVKLNNTYDNVFDLSLIDLEDVDRLEIIKGSNTALYGPEAFSGVINIVPKIQQDYNIRFQQRLGTYRSGNWGLHLYKKFDRLHSSYSLKRGGTEREIADLDEGKLENTTLHHTANLSYSLSENPDGSPQNSIGVMWLYTSLDYENRQRDGNDSENEFQNNFNHLVSFRYSGNLLKFRNFDLSVSWRRLEDDQFSSFTSGQLTGSQESGIEDKSFHINAEKRYEFGKADLLFGYQLQKADLLNELKISNNFGQLPDIPPRLDLERTHHGFVAIGKLRGDTGSDFLQNFNVDLSLRHDRVNDTQADASDSRTFVGNDWQETMAKFSVNAVGYREDLSTNAFLNFGTNVKFPTLFQQVNTPEDAVTLEPEKNSSFEGGVVISRETTDHPSIYGWQVSGNYFLNNYDDKLVEVRNLLGGRSLFLSTETARISGFEAKSSLFLFRKKLTVDFGWSRYFISEKEAFPFKSDFQRTLTFSVDHAGYSFQIHGFKEGEQVGLLRTTSGDIVQVPLPDYTNLDVHLSKTFEIGKFKVFANASARNLLEDDNTELLGLTIRDRRFYFTFGAQY